MAATVNRGRRNYGLYPRARLHQPHHQRSNRTISGTEKVESRNVITNVRCRFALTLVHSTRPPCRWPERGIAFFNLFFGFHVVHDRAPGEFDRWVACHPGAMIAERMIKEHLNPADLPNWSESFSQVVVVRTGATRTIYVSGQVSVDRNNNILARATWVDRPRSLSRI